MVCMPVIDYCSGLSENLVDVLWPLVWWVSLGKIVSP